MTDTETTPTRSSPVVRRLKAHWATIILAIPIVILIAQNTHRTSIGFRSLSSDPALWFVLVVTTVMAFPVGLRTARHRARRTA